MLMNDLTIEKSTLITVVIRITMMIPNSKNILHLRKKNKRCNESPSDNDLQSRTGFF